MCCGPKLSVRDLVRRVGAKNLSSKMLANCVFAANRSRSCFFHAMTADCRLGQIFVAADSAKPRLIFNNVQSQVGGCQVPESRFSARPSFHLRLSVDMPYTVPGLRSWIRGLHSRRATPSILAGQSGKRAEELLVKRHKQPRVRSPSKSTCSGAINLLFQVHDSRSFVRLRRRPSRLRFEGRGSFS